MMSSRSCLSIVLAAGEGTRMKSATPKVLHRIAGLPMLAHVARAAAAAGAGDIAVVVGGTIPHADVPKLLEAGAAAVFPTGTALETLVREIRELTGTPEPVVEEPCASE